MDPITSFNEQMESFHRRAAALHAALVRHNPSTPLHFAKDLLTMEDGLNISRKAEGLPVVSLAELFGPSKEEQQGQEWFRLEQERIRERHNIIYNRTWSDEERDRRVREVQHDLTSRGIPPAPPGIALHLAQARAYNKDLKLDWLRETPKYAATGNTVEGLTFAERMRIWSGGMAHTPNTTPRLESEEDRDTRQMLIDAKEADTILYRHIALDSQAVDCLDNCGKKTHTFVFHDGEEVTPVLRVIDTDLREDQLQAVVVAANAVPGLLKYIDKLHAEIRTLRDAQEYTWNDYKQHRWGK